MSDEGLFRTVLLLMVLWGHICAAVSLLVRTEWRNGEGIDSRVTLSVEAMKGSSGPTTRYRTAPSPLSPQNQKG
jgi:hypothetical protein